MSGREASEEGVICAFPGVLPWACGSGHDKGLPSAVLEFNFRCEKMAENIENNSVRTARAVTKRKTKEEGA